MIRQTKRLLRSSSQRRLSFSTSTPAAASVTSTTISNSSLFTTPSCTNNIQSQSKSTTTRTSAVGNSKINTSLIQRFKSSNSSNANLNKRVANVLGKSQKSKKSLNNINGASAPPVVDSKINGASVETTTKTTPIETNKTEESKKEESKKDDTKMEVTPEKPILDPTTPPEPPTTPKNYTYTQGHLHEFAPKLVVVGVGGAGGNAVNNMIAHQLSGVDFLALNTDAQHLSTTLTDNRLQIGSHLTSGLGCGANPDAGRLAAEESREEITELLGDAHMVFITAGMGGGTGTGAAPVVAEVCYNLGILTVGVVTKPFRFEGTHRMRLANEGLSRLKNVVDTMIVIPNQNLFALANNKTSFMDSFAIADNVLMAGVKSITDLMTTPGLINLDFADVQSVMHGMGNAILGTGQASNEDVSNHVEMNKTAAAAANKPTNFNNGGNGEPLERAVLAAQQALENPLLGDQMDIGTAKGMLVNITGGMDMTLFEVDRAAQCITERIQDENANIIFGSAYDESLDGSIRVSVVATGIDENVETVLK